MKKLDELLDAYAYESEIASVSYEMMGCMLNKAHINSRLEKMKLSDLYIYGGGFLGIQLYQAVSQFVNVCAVVDRSGKLLINLPEIAVIGLDEFEHVYNNQKVIITPVKFYRSICQDLSAFVPIENMFYLGEFLGGVC